jgi:hypothetical protein
MKMNDENTNLYLHLKHENKTNHKKLKTKTQNVQRKIQTKFYYDKVVNTKNR